MSGANPFPAGSGYVGQSWLQTGGTSFNALSFLVHQIIAGKAFAALVKVLTVTGGGTGQPPLVAVQPMVNQVDGFGNQVPHGTIYNLPCFRLQGGVGAVILDPAVGDIGQAIICDRDISAVKATGAIGGPGSFRHNDWSDGCYFGGFLNVAPTAYVQITAAGINIVAPGQAVAITSATLTHNGVNVGSTHEHSDPQGGDTGVPH
jgi:hypothetical protein